VTHALEQNQRLLTLSATPASGGLTVTAPATNIAAPPGPYILFLVNGEGVPSVGKMVRVDIVPPKAVRVINFSDVWKYDDSNVDRGTAWLSEGYDDSAWKAGPGQLGFGDDDEGTVLTRTSPSQPSVYFRKKFTLDALVSAASLELLHDDGVQVWINGVPVFSKYMAQGLDFAAFASSSSDNEYTQATVPLSPNPFRVGENTITVMVKQASGSSEDLSFALGLLVEEQEGPLPDALSLFAPNGGEAFNPGNVATIHWSSTGSQSSVELAWSSDGGATWTPIASEVAASVGSYSWTVPSVSTERALVRVSRVGGLSDTSDVPFTISGEVHSRVIASGSIWRYQDSGVNPGVTWNTLGFDDSAWLSGAGQLGYGDGDEVTVLNRTTPSQTSVYFRKKITLSGPVTSATLSVLFDDGLVVYVNGQQVFSRNVGFAEHERYATVSEENAQATVGLPLSPNPFVTGENIIAVMVKQNGRTSPDLSFDLSLDVGIMLEGP
jgi:galactose oxidase